MASGRISRSMLGQLKRFTWGHVIFLSALVGVVSGLGGIAFNYLVDKTDSVAMAQAAGFVAPRAGAEGGGQIVRMPLRRWVLVVSPALGGLLVGLLVFSLAPEAEGHGTDAVVRSFHHGRGVIRPRVPLVKAVASAITIGSGGSAGREGPIAQIGAGFGSALASWLRVGDRERRLLMLAGGGAGIGAVFRAPLGGALFMAEVLYRDMEFESAALVPTFVAAIVAYSIYCFINGSWGPIFTVPGLQFNHPMELPFYILLGALCAGVGWIYVKTFYGVRDFFARIKKIPRHLKPMIGGLLVGLVGFFFPQALGMGYGWTQLAIDGALTLRIMALIVIVKIGLTSLTISSGGSGGVFGPSIVIGGCLGGAVQDFVILCCSVRRNGKSLGAMAKEEIGPIGGFTALVAVLGIMIVLIAVLALVVVNALRASPWGVVTIGLTIPIAMLMGAYMRWIRPGRVLEASAMGLVLLALPLYAGRWVATTPSLALSTVTPAGASFVMGWKACCCRAATTPKKSSAGTAAR